jgi:hypothetical protein
MKIMDQTSCLLNCKARTYQEHTSMFSEISEKQNMMMPRREQSLLQ